MRKTNVLAVDDKRANLVALDAVLGDEHNMIYAESGPQAIELVRSRADIDLILLDVQMPGMDGFETAARIREIPDRRDIPIAFITAVYSDDPHIRRGYELGGVDYFSKPFDPSLLRRKVGVYTWMRRLEREGWSKAVRVGVIIADDDGTIHHMTDDAARLLSDGDGCDYASITARWGGALRAALSRGEGETDIESTGAGALRLRVSRLHSPDGAGSGSVIFVGERV